MSRNLRILLASIAAGTAITALLAAAIPVWLLLRVPGVLASPETETL